MAPITVIAGDGPLVLGQPHVGTMIPPEVSTEAPPWTFDDHVAAKTEGVLDRIVSAILKAAADLEA